MIKIPTSNTIPDSQVPIQKNNKHEKSRQYEPPGKYQFNSKSSNKSELDEILRVLKNN